MLKLPINRRETIRLSPATPLFSPGQVGDLVTVLERGRALTTNTISTETLLKRWLITG